MPVKKKQKAVGVKAKIPKSLPPMLATLVDKPVDSDDWIYEVKWDGYRSIVFLNKGKVEMRSRNNKSFNDKFYSIYDALKEMDIDAVLDGEIIVINEEGISDFGQLQGWRSEADGQLHLYVFDLLWYNGYSLLDVELIERRNQLRKIIPAHPFIHVSETFEATGSEFYEAAKKLKLEGIIAKRKDSIYRAGERTRDWLKIKIAQRHEVVIGGYTMNEGSNKLFSSILVGVYEKGKLNYTGKVGTGFSRSLQKEMMEQFKPLVRKTCPFAVEPDVNKPSRFRPNPPKADVVWLEPKLVCEVSYAEITADGVMRHPSFEAIREDKNAKQVKAEKAVPAEGLPKVKKKESVLHKKKIISKKVDAGRKTLLNPTEAQQVRTINGESLKFSNLDKLYWPKDKVTKRDMLNYYYQVAPYMLPYLKDRPQSMNRFPNGINGESFYQKDVTGKVPGWIKTFPYTSEGQKKNYLVCTNEASLLYMASLGCIEINPWSSRIQSPDNPDWCIIDLDPDKNKFDDVIETALVTKKILDAAEVRSFCKTSGSTGIHIYIPLGAKYSYEVSKEFGRLIATIVNRELPKFTSIERATADRRRKIYIDFLQNRPKATLAAAYSLRPKPGATVSMPLHWEEVKKGMRIQDFNIHNAIPRIKEQGDIFKPVLGRGINIEKAIKKLENL